MKTIGNILWFLFGGLIGGLSWVLAGCLWCVTIVGIPVGHQCFKFASLAFFPFGKEVVYGGGGFSLLVNILWLLLSGMEMALGYVILGCLWCVTIVGVPVGLQCFKMARLALMPFGASVVKLFVPMIPLFYEKHLHCTTRCAMILPRIGALRS